MHQNHFSCIQLPVLIWHRSALCAPYVNYCLTFFRMKKEVHKEVHKRAITSYYNNYILLSFGATSDTVHVMTNSLRCSVKGRENLTNYTQIEPAPCAVVVLCSQSLCNSHNHIFTQVLIQIINFYVLFMDVRTYCFSM